MQFRKEEALYFFEDHILHQLLRGALSGQPADSYYPEGFKRLLQHDASSPISYAETLRIYRSRPQQKNWRSTARA